MCEIRGYIEGIMAQLYTKVKLYLEANGKTEDEFDTPLSSGNVVLRNESESPSDAFIDKWEVSGLAQPTVEQLNALEAEATTLESNNQVIQTRKNLYGSTAEQLEYIVENGVDAFIARQTQIKSDNPKT